MSEPVAPEEVEAEPVDTQPLTIVETTLPPVRQTPPPCSTCG